MKSATLALVLLVGFVLCGDPSCNRAWAGGRVLSFKQAKKQFKRDYRKMKKEDAAKTQRFMVPMEISNDDGGGYYGGGMPQSFFTNSYQDQLQQP